MTCQYQQKTAKSFLLVHGLLFDQPCEVEMQDYLDELKEIYNLCLGHETTMGHIDGYMYVKSCKIQS